MDQSTGLLSGLCGLGIVCSGLLLVVLFVGIRLSGRGLLPLLSLILNRQTERETPVDLLVPRRRLNLRARAEAVDFDSALAQPQATGAAPSSAVSPVADGLEPADPPVSWRRGRSRAETDDLYGGLTDEDDELS